MKSLQHIAILSFWKYEGTQTLSVHATCRQQCVALIDGFDQRTEEGYIL